jgi:hypothetical protein
VDLRVCRPGAEGRRRSRPFAPTAAGRRRARSRDQGPNSPAADVLSKGGAARPR